MKKIKFGFSRFGSDYNDYVILSGETQDEILDLFREWLKSRGLNENNSMAWVEDEIS